MAINGEKTSISINININVECVHNVMYRLLEVPWIALGCLAFVPLSTLGPTAAGNRHWDGRAVIPLWAIRCAWARGSIELQTS